MPQTYHARTYPNNAPKNFAQHVAESPFPTLKPDPPNTLNVNTKAKDHARTHAHAFTIRGSPFLLSHTAQQEDFPLWVKGGGAGEGESPTCAFLLCSTSCSTNLAVQ